MLDTLKLFWNLIYYFERQILTPDRYRSLTPTFIYLNPQSIIYLISLNVHLDAWWDLSLTVINIINSNKLTNRIDKYLKYENLMAY